MILPGRDIWRVGIAAAPIAEIAEAGSIPESRITWLAEEPGFAFLADPFGIWRDGRLHLFVEAYDYQTRHGEIQLIELGEDFGPIHRKTVLHEPWHLSYPYVFEHDGEVWMAPEAHRSGALTIYRAAAFPDVWEPVVRLELDTPAIDATPFRHNGLWWLAYSPAGPQSWKQGRLHLAYAETLAGPWRPHPGNPVRTNRTSSRPGGSAFTSRGQLFLPVQDCSQTYGGALRMLRILELTPNTFEAEVGAAIRPPVSAGRYRDGLHSLSACGGVTLFDVKRIDLTLPGLAAGLAWFRRTPDL